MSRFVTDGIFLKLGPTLTNPFSWPSVVTAIGNLAATVLTGWHGGRGSYTGNRKGYTRGTDRLVSIIKEKKRLALRTKPVPLSRWRTNWVCSCVKILTWTCRTFHFWTKEQLTACWSQCCCPASPLGRAVPTLLNIQFPETQTTGTRSRLTWDLCPPKRSCRKTCSRSVTSNLEESVQSGRSLTHFLSWIDAVTGWSSKSCSNLQLFLMRTKETGQSKNNKYLVFYWTVVKKV